MSTGTTLIGFITDIFPTEQITERFKKRVFWLKQPDTETYPEHWQLECTQDATSLLDKYKVGDFVQASINIRGKKYSKNGKDSVFNSLVCWRIAKQGANGGGQQSSAGSQGGGNYGASGSGNANDLTEPLDDLPF